MTDEKLMKIYHKIHDLLRNKEGITEERALDQFNLIFSVKLLEPCFKSKLIIVSDKCLFSELMKCIDDELKLFSSFNEVLKELYFNELTKECYKNPSGRPLSLEIRPKTLRTMCIYLSEIDEANIDEDLNGKLYEYFIGRDPTTIKDLGQFFTNRKIVNMVVDVIDNLGYLKLDKKNNIPTICDPTCGTGGFLFGLVNKLMKKYPKINWIEQQKNVYGYDISMSCVRSTKLNLLCLTGVLFNNISHHNSLTEKIEPDKYDIILGNPPYGGDRKNKDTRTKYDDTYQELRETINIPIDIKEAIFSQLFMMKCGKISAIVLPSGFYFNSKKQYANLRQYLLEKYNVQKIIDIPQDAFENTNTKTSVIIFTNDGKTKDINYINFTDGKELIKVNINKIKERKYNLNWKIYDTKIEKIDDSYKIVKLKNICKFNEGIKKHPTSYGKISGKYRFHTGAEDTMLFTDDADVDFSIIIINRTNGSGKCHIFYDEKCSIALQTIVLYNDDIITTKYIYYYLLHNVKKIESLYVGGNHKNLSIETLEDLKIQIPKKIEYQKYVVESIEHLDNSIKQMEQFIINKEKYLCDEVNRIIKDNKCKKEKIKNICKFLKKSKHTAKEGLSEGKYPFYVCSEDHKYSDNCDYKDETIIIGSGGNPVIHIDKDFSCSTDNNLLVSDKNKTYWIYYYIKGNMKLLCNGSAGSTIEHVIKSYVEEIEIQIPEDEKLINKLEENHKNIMCNRKILFNDKVTLKELMKYYFK